MFAVDKLSYVAMQNDAQVDITASVLVFTYDRKALVVTYEISAALTLFAMSVGTWSFMENGVSIKTGFLSTMATTRNPDLDEVARRACLGADGTIKGMKKVKVAFGETNVTNSGSNPLGLAAPHAAFGLEHTTQPLNKRNRYA